MQTSTRSLNQPNPLTESSFAEALVELTGADPRLAAIYRKHGPPPFWTRDPGFPTLLRIILEQQVSLASALAAFRRVSDLADPLTPERFLTLSDQELRTAGFSRQKTAYGRILSQALLDGDLDLDELHNMDDDTVRAKLTGVKGIGPWTAEVYLLMALRRPDVWPVGDLALVIAVQEVLHLPARPHTKEVESLSTPWQPWRAVATRLFWHHYLSTERTISRGVTPPSSSKTQSEDTNG